MNPSSYQINNIINNYRRVIQHARKEGTINDTLKFNIKLFMSADRKQRIIEAITNETIKNLVNISENIKNENLKEKPVESLKKANTFTIIIFDENNNKCLKILNIDENNLIIDSEKKIK